MNNLVTIIILGVIIILQLVERNFHLLMQQKKEDKLLDELSKAIKAVISKNANDYVMTTAMDKTPMEEKIKTNDDFVAEESLSDEEFMKTINKGISE